MRRSVLILLAWAIGLNFAECQESNSVSTLIPLRLQLPAPSLGGNGPLNLPSGPHIDPYPSRPPAPLLVPVGVTNLARGKPVTSSAASPVRGDLSKITDGSKEAFGFDLVEIKAGVQWVQVDLLAEHSIYAIAIWHDAYFHYPVTRSVIVQVSNDSSFTNNVRTLFNNDFENCAGFGVGTDKEYFESHFGKSIAGNGANARYVRCYSNGNSNGKLNGYAEVEVWGLPKP